MTQRVRFVGRMIATAVYAIGLTACIETPAMNDADFAGVRLQFIGNGNNEAEVRVSHPARGSDSLVVLARQRVTLDSTVREVTVPLDVTDCKQSYPSGCPLRVDVFLLVDRTIVDSAGVGPVIATGAGVLDVPVISFRAATRLVPFEPLVRPRVNDIAQLVVYGIDARGDTLRGRAMRFTSSDTTVAAVLDRGRVRTLKVGSAVVTASREGLEVPIRVEVTPVRSLSVTWPTAQLYETGRDSVRGAAIVESGFANAVRWQSADSTIVRVSSTGQLTAGRRGTTTVTAIAVADSSQRLAREITVEPFQAAVRWDFVRTLSAPAFSGYATDAWGTAMTNVWVAASNRLFRFDGIGYTFDVASQCCITGVGGAAANDVWAVGNNIQRYDGQRWTTNSFRPVRQLWDVWASGSRAWAVGDSGYIVAFDSTNWTPMVSPTNQPLKRIWGRSATEIYATGSLGTILRFDGSRWTTMSSGVRDTLFAVAGDDQVVYAGGWSTDSLGFETRSVLQLVGGTWQRVAGAPISRVFSIWRTDALGWVVTGNFGIVDRIASGTLVAGSVEPDLPDRTSFNNMVGAGFPDGALVVGSDGAAIRVTADGRFTLQHIDPRYHAMCMDQRGHVMGAGHLGRLDRYDGVTTVSEQAGSRYINSLWCGATTTGAVAVGAFGSLQRFDGTQWISYPSPVGTTFLHSTWGASENDVFVGGDNGTILRWNGIAWTGVSGAIPGAQVFGLFGFGPNDVFAVGTGGRIARFNGTSWQTMASPVTTTLRRVWGTSPTDVWAVGDGQAVLRYDGQTWRRLTRPDTATGDFHAIWGSGPNDVYIGGCGSRGAPVVRWDGSRFVAVSNSGCTFSVVGSLSGGVLFGEGLRSVRRGFAPNGRHLLQPRAP